MAHSCQIFWFLMRNQKSKCLCKKILDFSTLAMNSNLNQQKGSVARRGLWLVSLEPVLSPNAPPFLALSKCGVANESSFSVCLWVTFPLTFKLIEERLKISNSKWMNGAMKKKTFKENQFLPSFWLLTKGNFSDLAFTWYSELENQFFPFLFWIPNSVAMSAIL